MAWSRHPFHITLLVDRDMFMFIDGVAKRYEITRSKAIRMISDRNCRRVERPVSFASDAYAGRFELGTYLSDDELDLLDDCVEQYNLRGKDPARMTRSSLIRACIQLEQERYKETYFRGGNKNEVH